MLDQVKALRLRGYSAKDIGTELGFGLTTAQRYIAKLDLTPEEIQQAAVLTAERRVAKLRRGKPGVVQDDSALLALQQTLLDSRLDLGALPTMPPANRGYVGELYVQYYLARRGLRFALPPFPEEGHDLTIFGASGKAYRCEVKAATQGAKVCISRFRYVSGKMQNVPYSGVDCFILVTLENENVFFLPGSEYNGSRQTFTCNPFTAVWQYKDKHDLFV